MGPNGIGEDPNLLRDGPGADRKSGAFLAGYIWDLESFLALGNLFNQLGNCDITFMDLEISVKNLTPSDVNPR